ncbi:MAG: PilZ domain-containing protein [Treponema sp.]|jgi:c-di-GMP-binding flagellar brake protein YcgR|nr:PilZ domain-containing protein [Treponema sp.]
MGMTAAFNLFPLQSTNLEGFASTFRAKTTSLDDAIWFIAGIGIIVVILIIVNILKNRVNIPALNGASGPASGPRQFSVFTLHRLAAGMGLDREQTRMLEFVLKIDGVADPVRSLNSPALLDRHFKRAYRVIERSSITDEELQEKISVLFATRNIIESNSGGVSATSTRQLPENAAAVLAVNGQNFPVRVVSSRGDSLIVENPVNNGGTALRLPRGSKVSLAFFTKSSKGFSFETRVLGSKETADGPMLYLVHSGQIKRLSSRRFRRRQTVIATSFYLVHIEIAGRRKERKMVVDKRRLSGNIMDISIGGCSIKTSAPVSSGQRLKIEFTGEDSSVAALGQVLRTNRTGMSTIMHIKFLKVPRRSLNSINAMVYEYADE